MCARASALFSSNCVRRLMMLRRWSIYSVRDCFNDSSRGSSSIFSQGSIDSWPDITNVAAYVLGNDPHTIVTVAEPLTAIPVLKSYRALDYASKNLPLYDGEYKIPITICLEEENHKIEYNSE